MNRLNQRQVNIFELFLA